MKDLSAAIAAAREALAKEAPTAAMDAVRLDGALRDLLAALDAANAKLADTQRAIIEAAERRGYERALKQAPPAASNSRMADALRWIVRYADTPERAARGPHRGMAAIKHVAERALEQAPPAAVPAGGLRDSVLNSAKFRASCYAMVGIVEGIEGLGRNWAANGERLKDTPEWVAFYNCVAAMRNGTFNQASAEQATPAAMAVPEGEESPAIGDYVLGTKYSDGDPGDPWAVGIYAGMKDGRHVVNHHDGTPIYAKGFRRVGKITHEQGRDMLKVWCGLEGAGGSLWAMLAAMRKGGKSGR